MKEIEVKFRVRRFDEIRAKLQKMGAGLVWKGMEENYFFDTRDRSLNKKGILLRLRHWDNHSNTLTVKTKVSRNKKYKIKDEYQVEISDIDEGRKLFTVMGFREHFRYRKYREHWKLGKASVELDKIEHLLFVEIEAPPKEIDRLAGILGLGWNDAVREGYIRILERLHSLKKRG